MSWESGSATSYTDLLDKPNAFLLKGHALPITWHANRPLPI